MMFEQAKSMEQAIAAKLGGATLLAGGTSVVDLMQLGVEIPSKLLFLQGLGLESISHHADGGVSIGALCQQSRLAQDAGCQERFPLLREAILSGASGQIRNMATVAGNLLQRTRCSYFREFASPCNKRNPGSGCPALHAPARGFALFGRSAQCVATFPSDQATTLVALDASIVVQGKDGTRTLPLVDFYRLPGETPNQDNELRADEVVTAIEIPAATAHLRTAYVKVRDRQSYVFALVSAAVALRLEEGRITFARIVLGNVAAKPWRALAAEAQLLRQPVSADLLDHAAHLAVSDAYRVEETEGKIRLARAAVREALHRASKGASAK